MEYYILLIKQNKNKAKKSQKGKKGNVLISTSLLFMHIHVVIFINSVMIIIIIREVASAQYNRQTSYLQESYEAPYSRK